MGEDRSNRIEEGCSSFEQMVCCVHCSVAEWRDLKCKSDQEE